MESIGRLIPNRSSSESSCMPGLGSGSDTTTGTGANAAGRPGSSDESPLPSALRGLSITLFISDDFLCQLQVTFGAAGPGIVGQNGFSIAGSLGQADTSRNRGFQHLVGEKLPQVLG